jgi:ribokinase
MKCKSKVINIGSINIDNVYNVDHIVEPGETIASSKMDSFVGGKGANQSVAIARAGVKVFHVGKVGQDGIHAKDFLSTCGVNTDFIDVDITGVPTGHAIIQLDTDAENSIILFQGCNHQLDKDNVKKAIKKMTRGDIMILQNEVNNIAQWINLGHEAGLRICFNPAPCELSVKDYPIHLLEWLILNETEACILSGVEEKDEIIKKLTKQYPNTKIILTLGNKGACLITHNRLIEQPAQKVKVIDTVAAGDTFVGYFIAGIIDGLSEKEALFRANHAAAICVGRPGAAQAIPTIAELNY